MYKTLSNGMEKQGETIETPYNTAIQVINIKKYIRWFIPD